MMKDEHNKKLDELIAESIGRSDPVFDFEQWKADHADAVRRYQQLTHDRIAADRVSSSRRCTMPKLIKYAAAAIIIITAVVGLYQIENSGNSSLAFAAVIDHIQSNSYTFDLIFDQGQSGAIEPIAVEVLEPGRMRFDAQGPMGPISSICDLDRGKTLILFHGNRAAIVKDAQTDITQVSPFALWRQPVENLWNLQDGTEERLETRKIDGVNTQGFRVSSQDHLFINDITVWADAQTGVPVLVELVSTAKDGSGQKLKWKMANFNFDVQLDPKQFSVNPPAGYTLAYQKDLDQLFPKGNSSPAGQKILEVLELGRGERITAAIDLLLTVDFNQPIRFARRPYIFSITEQDYVSLKMDDQQTAMKEVMKDAAVFRNICRTIVSQSKKTLSGGDINKAQSLLEAGQHLGQILNRKPDQMIIVRMVGIAIEKVVLNELIPLYQKIGDTDKTNTAQQRLQQINNQSEEIKRKASGR